MDLTGPLALAGLILVKEAGLPVPVPGDLLVLGAGVAAARGDIPALPTILIIVLASVVGGGVQFWLIRGRGRRIVTSLLERFGVPRERLETQTTRLRGAGARGVAVARMTPGLRVVAIAASGLADLPGPAFLAGLIVGNAVFMSGHFLLGALVGEPAINVVGKATSTLAIVVVALAVLGALGWWVRGRIRSRNARRLAVRATGEAVSLPRGAAAERRTPFEDWADAACPACLALSVLAPGVRGDA